MHHGIVRGFTRALVWALPTLFVLGCKPKPPQLPDEGDSVTTSHYGEAAYSTNIPPIQVCEHLARMVAAEAGVLDPQLDPSMMSACDKELSIEAATRGTANWNEIAACVLQAQNEADLNACDERHPMPADSNDWSSAGNEREQSICEHMLGIAMQEAAAELGEALPPISEQELLDLRDECVASLLTEQRPNLDPGDYEQLLSCIASAQTTAQLQSC